MPEKSVLSSFIYNRMCEFYLRIPLKNAKINEANPYDSNKVYATYFSKENYTLREVMNIRNNLILQFEKEGLRRTRPSKGSCKDYQWIMKHANDLPPNYSLSKYYNVSQSRASGENDGAPHGETEAKTTAEEGKANFFHKKPKEE